jgi:L-iditol 2-dehydrogenase
MRALVCTASGVALARVPIPERRPGEVRVRVLLTGICRTDLFAADGQIAVSPRRVLGHEAAGVVDEADPGAPVRPGDRVAVHPALPCGECRPCREGRACSRPRMLGLAHDGAFAEWITVPAGAVYRVPDALSSRHVAYVEPVAAALAVLRAPFPRDGSGLVLGKNRIAELTMRALSAHGVARFAQAGADDPLEDDAFDWAIETVATRETLAAILRAVRPGGVIILKSRPAAEVPLDVALAVRKDITLHAVSYAPFDAAIALLGRLDVDDLLGDVFPLEAYAEAFARARGDESRKLFLDPTTDGAR